MSAFFPRVVIGDSGNAITYNDVYESTPKSDTDTGSPQAARRRNDGLHPS